MRKIFALLLAAGACAHAPQSRSGSGTGLTGSAAPRIAVEQFLNAVKAQDIQAMSGIFGTSSGAARDNMDRISLEKRMLIIQCFFNHDRFRITNESNQGSNHVFQFELTRGTRTRQTSAMTVRGPSDRWYVETLDIAAVRDFCAEPKS